MKTFKNMCLLQSVLIALSLMAFCNSANAADNIIEVADKAGTFKTLLAAAKAAGLAHTLQEDGPFTVFAPTDDAFAKLPKHTLNDLLKPENKEKLATILKYHVVSGKVAAKEAVQVGSAKTLSGDSVSIAIRDGRLAVNDANVIVNDLEASNGVIHVIDSVLLPPPSGPGTIVETAARAGTFKTLLAAAEAAGLVDALNGDGPLTVFAPTDEAFSRLPEKQLKALLKPEEKCLLAEILKYHVVAGRITVGDALNKKSLKTLNGDTVEVGFADGSVKVADATVRAVDIESTNGLIHVIDRVMLNPKNSNPCKARRIIAMIKDAISRGEPVFNRGDHGKCAEIYMTLSKRLLNEDEAVPQVHRVLQKAVNDAEHSSSDTTRALSLRHGLDQAYAMAERAIAAAEKQLDPLWKQAMHREQRGIVLSKFPQPTVTAIDGSGTHSLFLLSDGTVWGSGWNYNGELGDGTILERHSPIPILSDVKDIAAGAFQSLFLGDDGSVWAAGANDSGQLGDGTNEERRITPVIIMADVADMAVGNFHCLFLKKDGTVWTSGRNSDGQLGDGTTTSRNDPMQVMAEVAAIEAGQSHSLFLKKDGSVWATGQNKYGQLGDGMTTARSDPVQITTDVIAISAGLSHSLFLKKDGSVWATGGNVHGQLGDETRETRSTPVRVAIEDVVAISAGCSHSLFLKTDGSVWATGRNVEGQLGDETKSNRLKPLASMTNVAAISAGRHFSMFLKTDGSVWCVGENTRGQLGDGTIVNRATPVEVSFRNTPNPDIEFEREFSQQFIIGGPLPENPRGAREARTGTTAEASDLSKEELEQNKRGAGLVDELFKEWSQSDEHLPMFLALSTIVADEGIRCSILDLSRDPRTGKQSPNVDVPLLLYAYHSSYVLPDCKNRPVHDRKAVLVLVNGKTGRPIDYVFETGYRSENYSWGAGETTEWTTEWEQQDGTQTRYRILASGFQKIDGAIE